MPALSRAACPSAGRRGARFGRRGGGAASLWTPTALGSAVVGWYDARVGITLNGADVDSWADQSGRGNNLTAQFAANRPLFEAAGLGTGASMLFNGTDDKLYKAAFSWGAAVSAYSIALIGQGVSFTNNDVALGYTTAIRLRQGITDKLTHLGPGGAVANISTTVESAARVWIGEWNGATQYIFTNTTQEDSDANATAAPADGSELSLGSAAGGSVYWNGRVGALLIVNRVLTAAEKTSLYGWAQRAGWVA